MAREHIDETVAYLRLLHPTVTEHLVEFRLKPEVGEGSVDSEWDADPAKIESNDFFVDQLIGLNRKGRSIYVSLGKRRGETRGGENTVPGQAVLADFDQGEPLEHVLATIKARGLPSPSAVVETSPNHFHTVWPLTEPLPSLTVFKAVQQGLSELLGSCGGVDSPEQNVRLPGPFINAKPGRPEHRVRLVSINPELRHELSLFPQAEVVEPSNEPLAMTVAPGSLSDHSQEIIANGLPPGCDRRPTIFAVQRDMASRGHDEQARLEVGLKLGRDAGLTEAELRDVHRSAKTSAKGNPQPGFAKAETATITGLVNQATAEAEGLDLIDAVSRRSKAPWPSFPSAMLNHPTLQSLYEATDPFTEADPVAVAVTFLAAFGNVIGRGPRLNIATTWHHTHLFVGIVGSTSTGRKGTSRSVVDWIMRLVDPAWIDGNRTPALSTYEGLVHMIRDPREKVKRGKKVIDDPGVDDKRLFVALDELVTLFKVGERTGNTINASLRPVWDGLDKLRLPPKGAPDTATNPHISLLGHATFSELLSCTTSDNVTGGLYNRIIWVCSRKSKDCSAKGLPGIDTFADFVREGVDFARHVGEVTLTAEVAEASEQIRRAWEAATPPGRLEDILGRAHSQTMRMALILALTRGSSTIEAVDLSGALALWGYADRSARYIFRESGSTLSETSVFQDQALALIKEKPGITRAQLYKALRADNRPGGAAKLMQALNHLEDQGLAKSQTVSTSGRPKEEWHPAQAQAVPSFDLGTVEPAPAPKAKPKAKKAKAKPAAKPKAETKPKPAAKPKRSANGQLPPGTYSLEDFIGG